MTALLIVLAVLVVLLLVCLFGINERITRLEALLKQRDVI